ncbi:hypothetical protein [Capnocytophaga sp.]|uniref:hypothetical protein n=1 Tax=Capnocytophaga sp. TaxID=44737 RepID=UPI0026DAF850|nr:hypothetical protein [Capnocytophaga sp.]MDO5106484.1 hypothetical protein [Capnocytophaga sp.]
MKTNKLNSATMTGAVAFSAGAVTGAMVSRVLYDKIPLKDKEEGKTTMAKVKRGLLAAAGIVGAAMIDSKETTGKAIQGAAVGMAATQIGYLLKEVIEVKEDGIFKTALGNPQTPVVVYANDGYLNYGYHPFDEFEEEPRFLSGAEQTEGGFQAV